jgi:hypothetical protein
MFKIAKIAKKMKKNITKMTINIVLITMFFVGGTFAVKAAVKINSDFKDGIITAEGACDKDVVIELFSGKTMSEVIYSAGAACKGGKFSFSDNLTKWNIIDGSYVLAVDGQLAKDGGIEIKKEAENKDVVQSENREVEDETQEGQDVAADDFKTSEHSEQTVGEFDRAAENFGEGMDKMNESLETMDKAYNESKYAENSFMRTIIDLMKETLKTISGLFAQLVATQGDSVDVQTAENSVAEEGADVDSSGGTEVGEVQPVMIE